MKITKAVNFPLHTIATEDNSPIVKELHKEAIKQLIKKGMKRLDAVHLMRTNADKGYCVAYNL